MFDRLLMLEQLGIPAPAPAERLSITEVGPATVTVPAGTYQATLLQQTVTSRGGGREVIRSWVVNGIGQVKTDTSVLVKGGAKSRSSKSSRHSPGVSRERKLAR